MSASCGLWRVDAGAPITVISIITHSVEAVRVALMRLFERFVIYVDGGNGRIDAIVRDEAVRTVDEQLRPILRPVGLDLEPQPDPANRSGIALASVVAGRPYPVLSRPLSPVAEPRRAQAGRGRATHHLRSAGY
jgi:hypothetical protein